MTEPTGPRSGERADTLTALLRHFSWSPSAKVPGRYEVWTSGDDEREIIVPINPEKGDYEPLLDRVDKTLSGMYGSELQQVLDLLIVRKSSNLASTRWHKETAVNAGLISWIEGEALFRAAQDSLTASAKATHERRMHHGKSSSYVAKKFLERTLMGQTEIGSFVITAHTPSSERFHLTRRSENRSADDWRKAEMVTGGQILETLEQSLRAVRSGLDEYRKSPNLDGFVPLIEDGVSFELVRSLSDLTRGGDAAVSIDRSDADDPARPTHVEVAFDSVESSVLEQVSKKFKEAKPPESVRIVGEVSLLDNSTSSPVHLVRVDIKEGSKVKRARVRLTPDQYDLAVEAHAEHSWLKVSGQLQLDGRDYWLYNAHGVDLVDPSQGPDSVPDPLDSAVFRDTTR